MAELSPSVSPALVQALVAAGLIELCPACVRANGLCGPCLEREGPRLAKPTLWFRLMGVRNAEGCEKCGGDMRVVTDWRPHPTQQFTEVTMYLECRSCFDVVSIETQEQRRAREEYEAKAQRRAEALQRQSATTRSKRAHELEHRHRIPVQRVA